MIFPALFKLPVKLFNMRIKIRLFIPILAIAFLSVSQNSCVNNNEEDLYGIKPCDTEDVTWESPVKEILQQYCVMCHGPTFAAKGVRHDSYEAEKIVINDGRLRGVINHLPGYPKMPKDRGKLPECELNILNTWLDNGAPEF